MAMAPVLAEDRYTRTFRLIVTTFVIGVASCGTVATAALGAPGLAALWGAFAIFSIYFHLSTYEKLERDGECSVRLSRPLGTTEVTLSGGFTVRSGWGGPRTLVLRAGGDRYRLIGTIGGSVLVTEWLQRT